MKNYEKLVDYFSDFLEKVTPENREKLIIAYKLVDDRFYDLPAASGNHHNDLQACEHGLLYHIYEGLIALDQFIRARSDIIDKFAKDPAYEGSNPASDLFTAYLMHDICKFKADPSGSNYEHDEDGYHFAKMIGFNPVVCEIIRFTHGQWSTAARVAGKTIFGARYQELAWLSHYADMAASTMKTMKFVDKIKTFDKTYFSNNRNKKKTGDSSIDKIWWTESAVKEYLNDTDRTESGTEEETYF
ncbi:MAG: HD domain-containing protein [Paludibacteraceae bacterium]|nr:HD domain-containing protein [Paludibacteraceae bacterium]